MGTSQEIIVSTPISDLESGDHGVAAAMLFYSYTSPYNQSQIAGAPPNDNGDGLWEFTIPPQGSSHLGDSLRFFITATDGDWSPAESVNDNQGQYFEVLITDSVNKEYIYMPTIIRGQ